MLRSKLRFRRHNNRRRALSTQALHLLDRRHRSKPRPPHNPPSARAARRLLVAHQPLAKCYHLGAHRLRHHRVLLRSANRLAVLLLEVPPRSVRLEVWVPTSLRRGVHLHQAKIHNQPKEVPFSEAMRVVNLHLQPLASQLREMANRSPLPLPASRSPTATTRSLQALHLVASLSQTTTRPILALHRLAALASRLLSRTILLRPSAVSESRVATMVSLLPLLSVVLRNKPTSRLRRLSAALRSRTRTRRSRPPHPSAASVNLAATMINLKLRLSPASASQRTTISPQLPRPSLQLVLEDLHSPARSPYHHHHRSLQQGSKSLVCPPTPLLVRL